MGGFYNLQHTVRNLVERNSASARAAAGRQELTGILPTPHSSLVSGALPPDASPTPPRTGHQRCTAAQTASTARPAPSRPAPRRPSSPLRPPSCTPQLAPCCVAQERALAMACLLMAARKFVTAARHAHGALLRRACMLRPERTFLTARQPANLPSCTAHPVQHFHKHYKYCCTLPDSCDPPCPSEDALLLPCPLQCVCTVLRQQSGWCETRRQASLAS